MNNIINFNTCKNQIVGEKIGTLSVSMYIDKITSKPFFYIQSENEDMLQVSYIVEDALYHF